MRLFHALLCAGRLAVRPLSSASFEKTFINQMKTQSQFVILSLWLWSAFNPTGTVFAQGNLNPPGAPAPMFRTLEEVQPRRPIGTNATPGDSNALFIISQPGSYF